MSHPYFVTLPDVDEICRAARSITPHMAQQIIQLVRQYTRDDDARLALINDICAEVEQHGAEAWHDIRWQLVVSRVNSLSSQINDTMGRYARR